MKLLLDQNISYRVARKLGAVYPIVTTVRDEGLYEQNDRIIWEYSRQNGFSIITFDEDLYDLTTLYGPPPKIIWLRTGNLTNEQVVQLLTRFKPNIELFLQTELDEASGCLAVYASGTINLQLP
jgi:predicted nuclease of predicted toxin-antitoxin system